MDSTQAFQDQWSDFGDTPVDNDGFIVESFEHFPAGTHRETVWRWFESVYPVCIGAIMDGAP